MRCMCPDAVWQEVVNGGKDDAAARIVPTLDWFLLVYPVEVALDIKRWNLGAGESAVMHHARELTDRAILDDALLVVVRVVSMLP